MYGYNEKGMLTVEDNYIDLVTPEESPKEADMYPPSIKMDTVSPSGMLPTDEPDVTVEPNVEDGFQLPPAARMGVPMPDHTEYVVQFQDHGILPGRNSLKRKRVTAVECCVCDYCQWGKPLGNRAADRWAARLLAMNNS